VWMRMIARGKPGHGSVPHADNAVVHLSRAIDKLAKARLPMIATRTAGAYITGIADAIGGGQGIALRAWLDMEALHDVPLHRLITDQALAAELHAITHNTVVPTGLRGGYKANVIPSSVEATLDCRTLPGYDAPALIEELRGVLGEDAQHIDFEVDSSGVAVEFPVDTPLYRLIGQTIRQHDPHGIPLPYMLSGATDAKHVAKLGTICYGFSPLKFAPGGSFFDLVHGNDERVAVSALAWGVRVLEDVVRQCATQT